MIIKNCRIFDGNSFINDTAVLIEDDKIIKTLPESELSDYTDKETIDLIILFYHLVLLICS